MALSGATDKGLCQLREPCTGEHDHSAGEHPRFENPATSCQNDVKPQERLHARLICPEAYTPSVRTKGQRERRPHGGEPIVTSAWTDFGSQEK